MAWMDVVNLHPLLTLFTIVILLAGLFFLYPVVSFSYSNNVMQCTSSPPPPSLGSKQGVQLPASHTLYSLLLFCWLVFFSCTQWYVLANNVIPLDRRQGSPNLQPTVLCIPFSYPLYIFHFLSLFWLQNTKHCWDQFRFLGNCLATPPLSQHTYHLGQNVGLGEG